MPKKSSPRPFSCSSYSLVLLLQQSCSPVCFSPCQVSSSQSRNYYPRTYKPTNIFLVPNRICLPLFLSSFSLFSPFFSFIYFLGGRLPPLPPPLNRWGVGERRPKIRRTFVFFVNIMYNGTKKAEECCRLTNTKFADLQKKELRNIYAGMPRAASNCAGIGIIN